MSVKENMLIKTSNSYAYYKENYKILLESQKRNNRNLKFNEKYIDFLQRDLKTRQKTIERLEESNIAKREVITDLRDTIKVLKNTMTVLKEDMADRNELSFQLADEEELTNILEERYLALKKPVKKDFKDINIGYVLRGFPILSETFIISEVKWLIDHGYNVTVFTYIDSYKPVDLDFHVENVRYERPSKLKAELLKHDIDLVHTHFVYPTCTDFTWPVCEKLKIPFTVFAHAFDIFRHAEDRLNRVGEITQSPYCMALFTLSEYHKNYLMKRNVPEDKIVITKQASDYEITPIQEKTNKIKKIVSLSRFVEKKGIDVLIKAAKLLEEEDFEFNVYGFGDLEESYKELMEEIECTNVKLNDELPHDKVKDLLMSSDLLVAPSKIDSQADRDGFPTVIFESMAVGLPVLTTDVSAIPEIIKDGYNGFLTESNNPEKLAEKIKEIAGYSNEDLMKIRKQAQKDVKNISSVDKTMEKYIDTVRQ